MSAYQKIKGNLAHDPQMVSMIDAVEAAAKESRTLTAKQHTVKLFSKCPGMTPLRMDLLESLLLLSHPKAKRNHKLSDAELAAYQAAA